MGQNRCYIRRHCIVLEKPCSGRFIVECVIPKDINFGPGKATIRLFAQSNNVLAAGALPIRIAGSTGTINRDTTGPQIKLYLNDTTFKNGGITSENPILLAQLFDTSGINATGNGIGHDIVLVKKMMSETVLSSILFLVTI